MSGLKLLGCYLGYHKWRLAGLALVAGVLLVFNQGLAFAGSFSVKDEAGILSSADLDNLRSAASKVGPDIYVVTSNNYSNSDQFANFVKSNLSSPTAVVIGVSTTGLTYLEVGSSTGITPAQASEASKAGGTYFQNKDWRGGLEAIIQKVGSLSSLPASCTSCPGTTTASESSGWLILAGLAVVVVGAVLIFWWYRSRARRRQLAGQEGDSDLRGLS